MQTSKVQRVIELVHTITSKKTELNELETELNGLLKPARSASTKSKRAAKSSIASTKPARSKLKILKILQRAKDPMSIPEISKKVGLTNSGVYANLTLLIKEGQAYRASYGRYASKSN